MLEEYQASVAQTTPAIGQLYPQAQQVREQLLEHIREQSERILGAERIWGGREILESAFGKLKCLEQNDGRDGLTSRWAALPALWPFDRGKAAQGLFRPKNMNTKMGRIKSGDLRIDFETADERG